MIETKIKSKKPRGANASMMYWDNDPRDMEPIGYVMTLDEMKERQVLACDIFCMLHYPVPGSTLPRILNDEFDSKQRIIFFIPGEGS